MNCLPIGLERLANPAIRSEYYAELDRMGFDTAWAVFDLNIYCLDVERWKRSCADFSSEARERGFGVCVMLPTSACPKNLLNIAEAQRDQADRAFELDAASFRPSPASPEWKGLLRDLTSTLVRDCGFEWVVIEEPVFVAGLPGVSDRIHDAFVLRCPECPYPTKEDESPEYLKLQQFKADAVLQFCSELARHAVSAGAAKVGVMPQAFLPTADGEGVPRTACDVGQLAQMAEVSFLVSRLGPAEVFAGCVVSKEGKLRSVEVCFVEAMAHSLVKPVISVVNPAGKAGLVPTDFFRDAVYATLAAQPSGFAGYDFDAAFEDRDEYSRVLSEVGPQLGKLGSISTAAAFVFSDSGTRHIHPDNYTSVSEPYWAFIKHMMYGGHVPVLTFHASSLRQNLADHPEVGVLVLEEHFPVSTEQIKVLRDWWQGPERKAVVAFGSGLGFSADPEMPSLAPCARSMPGVLELIGLRQDAERPMLTSEQGFTLRDVSRTRRSAFLGESTPRGNLRVANVRRVFGSRAAILYDVVWEDEAIPVVSEYRDRSTLAVFCGFGLSRDTAAAAEKAVKYAIREVDADVPILTDCSEGLLWSLNRHGFIVMSNTTDRTCTAVGRPGRNTFWDCVGGSMLPQGDPVFSVEPHSFQVYRVVGRRSKFYDVKGISSLSRLVEGAGRADIEITAGRETTFVLRTMPKEVLVDGSHSAVTQQVVNGAYHVSLDRCPPGDRKITLRW